MTGPIPIDDDSVSTLECAGSCPNCHYVLPRLVDCAPAYFRDGYVACSHCQERIDLWAVVFSRAVKYHDIQPWALRILGAAQIDLVKEMQTGCYYEIDLTQFGVPENARIISRHCSSQGGVHGSVTALEWPQDWTHRIKGTTLRLVGFPVMEGPVPRVGTVLVSAIWIRNEDSEAWPYLVTAFDAAARGDYGPAIVFAQSAVEISMMPVIEKKLLAHAGTGQVERFMNDALTYSHALNVVLPFLCGEANVPKMPDSIRGGLNKLRKIRNEIIHQGLKSADVTSRDAVEGMCAASFGFEYVRYAEKLLGTL